MNTPYNSPFKYFSNMLTQNHITNINCNIKEKIITRRWLVLLLVIVNSLLIQNIGFSQSCECTDYLYVNDQNGPVHKFEINTATGALTEVTDASGNLPFIPDTDGFPLWTPHGLAIDNNGSIYIGRHFGGDNEIQQYNCAGELTGEDFLGAVNQQRLNFGSYNGILYEPDNGIFSGQQTVAAYDLCDGSLIGRMQINTSATLNTSTWGFHVDDTYWYVMDYATTNCVHRGLLDISLYNATGTNTGSQMTVCAGDGPHMGITSDAAGNMYIVAKQDRDGQLNDFEIRKYSPTGALLATAADPSNGGNISTPGQAGFWGARGLDFSEKSGYLYVGNFENCVTVFDSDLNQLSTLNVPNPGAGNAKGVRIATECCPDNPNLSITENICAADATGTTYFINDLFGCEAPVCEGIWTEDSNTSGGSIAYNSCNQSITVDGNSGCAVYVLISNGSGNKNCGVLDLSINICIEDCTSTPCTTPNCLGISTTRNN